MNTTFERWNSATIPGLGSHAVSHTTCSTEVDDRIQIVTIASPMRRNDTGCFQFSSCTGQQWSTILSSVKSNGRILIVATTSLSTLHYKRVELNIYATRKTVQPARRFSFNSDARKPDVNPRLQSYATCELGALTLRCFDIVVPKTSIACERSALVLNERFAIMRPTLMNSLQKCFTAMKRYRRVGHVPP